MNFTPNDLHNIEFSKTLRGYSESEIKEALHKIVEDYSSYIQENIELRDRVALLNEGIQHYKNLEESLQNTLVIAQQTGEDIKKTSYEKADSIIREAECRAQRIVNDANDEIIKLRYEYEDIRKNISIFKVRAEALLKTQLETLRYVDEEENENQAESELCEFVNEKQNC